MHITNPSPPELSRNVWLIPSTIHVIPPKQTGSEVIALTSKVQENAVPKLFVAPTVNDPTWTDFFAAAA